MGLLHKSKYSRGFRVLVQASKPAKKGAIDTVGRMIQGEVNELVESQREFQQQPFMDRISNFSLHAMAEQGHKHAPTLTQVLTMTIGNLLKLIEICIVSILQCML